MYEAIPALLDLVRSQAQSWFEDLPARPVRASPAGKVSTVVARSAIGETPKSMQNFGFRPQQPEAASTEPLRDIGAARIGSEWGIFSRPSPNFWDCTLPNPVLDRYEGFRPCFPEHTEQIPGIIEDAMDTGLLFSAGELSARIEHGTELAMAHHATPVISERGGKAETPSTFTLNLPVNQIIEGDSVLRIKELPSSSVHLILSDIPYGIGAEEWDVLHDNTNSAYLGSSPAQEKAGAIFKKRGKPINGWSEADREIPKQYYDWCSTWASEWFRVLKPGGSAIVFAGRRFCHRCVCALEDAGFSFKDMLSWLRDRAPHRAQRVSVVFERRGDAVSSKEWEGWRVGNLRPTFEPILWFTKPYKIGTTIADNALNHGVGPYNENAFLRYVDSPDNVLNCGLGAGEGGLHPTQKPVRLMQALIELTTQPDQIVLDPFAGSGSTLVAAQETHRDFIGYELDPKHVETCSKRLGSSILLPFTK